MTRKKVKLAFITNDSARKATFKKRKTGLMKKVNELSTLCGIETCALIYSQYDQEPEIWPSALGVQRVISRFTRMSEVEQSKKMVDQESFLKQRIAKAEEQLKKQRRQNHEMEITKFMFRGLVGQGLQNLNMVDLNELGWSVQEKIMEIEKKIQFLKPMADELRKNIGVNGQQWYMELLNQNQHKGFGANQTMHPHTNNNNGLLTGFFFL